MVKTFLITGHSLHKWAKYTIYCYVSYNMYLFCFCQHATYAQSTVLNLINMVKLCFDAVILIMCVCVCWIGTRQTQLHGLASKLNQNLCNVLEVGPSLMVKHQWKVIYVQNTSLSARPLEHVHTHTFTLIIGIAIACLVSNHKKKPIVILILMFLLHSGLMW